LITLNPSNGALITSIPITAGGINLSIAYLAIQPGTNTLFGITNPDGAGVGPGNLYSINKGTGVATLIGNTGLFFNSIAFAPDGTLYLGAANLDFATGAFLNTALDTINSTTAAVLTSVSTTDFFGALGIRSDGTIFGGTGDQHELFTINPATGVETLIGDTGTTFIGDLAFSTPETGATLSLMAIGFAGLVGCARMLRPSRPNRRQELQGDSRFFCWKDNPEFLIRAERALPSQR
jgi:outer membrane protein assembly factor BamB